VRAVPGARVDPLGRLGQQGRLEPRFDEPRADPHDGAGAGVPRGGDLVVGPGRCAGDLVGLEEDPGVRPLAGVGLARADHRLPFNALLGC
jgi:hypothetical protein